VYTIRIELGDIDKADAVYEPICMIGLIGTIQLYRDRTFYSWTSDVTLKTHYASLHRQSHA